MPFLSVVVRPRGQRCQNKISFDRLQPEQIKQDEVKSFEFYLIYIFLVMYIYFFLCVFISFYVYLFIFYFLLFLFISSHFFLFLFIAVYCCLFLFISFYFYFLAKNENMILNVFFDFRIIQTMLQLTYCNLHHHFVLRFYDDFASFS